LEKLELDSIVYSDGWKPITSSHSTASSTGASTTDNHDKTRVDGK
jgi:hypothetical protein